MADQQKSDTHDPDPTGNKLADDSIDASGQGERVNDTKGSDNDLLNAIEKWTGEKEGENRQLLEYIVQFVAGQHNLEENLTRLIPLSMVSWTGHGSKADDNVSDHLDVHQWRESYDSDTTGALEDIRKRVNIKSIKRRLKRSAVEGLVYNKLGYSPYVPGMSGTIQTMGLHKPAIARRTLMQDILEPDEWKDKDSDEMDTHSCSSDSSQGRGGTPEYNYKPLKPDSNEEVGRFNRYIKKPREKLTWLYDLRPRPNFDPGEYEIAEEDLIDDWPSLCPNWPAGFLRDERRVEEEEDKNCEQIRKKRKNRRLLRHDDVMLDASLFAAQYDSESLGTDDSSSTYSATAPKSDTDVEMSQSTEGSVISMDTETDPEVCPEECPEEGAEEGAEEVPEEVPEEGAEEGADGQRDEIQDPAASIDIDTGDSGDSGEEIPQWPKSFFSPFTEVVWVPRNPATPRAQQLTRSFRRIVDSDGIDIAPSVQLARKRKAKARPPYRTDIYVTMNSMNKNVLFLTNAAKNNVQERRRCYLDNSEPATPVTVLAAMTVQWWLFIVLLILGLLLWFWRADGLPLTGYR
ncbi:hypothetical protein BDV25DRAFT_148271 [Aspergillus avenaceus]|uniref:Uncharacterized protein n=1 Tax=Aspergillus avenaceus TaxID=36643 RepID=A0A5N6U686_ASPAV|nr:hypothetical protein BDV25DRAFT_148271 [Aspergillus avenaceus]